MSTLIPKINVKNILNKMSEEPAFLKAEKGQLMADGKPLGPALTGKIKKVEMQYSKWAGDKFIKKSLDCPAEERAGFELEMTVSIHANGTRYGLTLPKKSMKKNFCPYLEMLEARNLNLEDVNTRIAVTQVNNRDFSFHVFSFTLDEADTALSAAA